MNATAGVSCCGLDQGRNEMGVEFVQESRRAGEFRRGGRDVFVEKLRWRKGALGRVRSGRDRARNGTERWVRGVLGRDCAMNGMQRYCRVGAWCGAEGVIGW